jgi:hypothetical protein
MKALLGVSIALLLSATSSSAGILAPGKYNGVVIFDRWDGCHLYTGVYQMEISEKVKESLRPYNGKAVLIDAQEVYEPMNPGDGLITKLRVLGPAENTTPPHIAPPPTVEGLSLRSIPSFSQQGYDELIMELRNDASNRRGIDTYVLGPTLLTKRQGFACLSPADGPSYPILTAWSVSFMQQVSQQASCQVKGKPVVARAFLAPGFSISQKFDLDSGQSIEIPIRFKLSPGEYEFLAGYGGSYQGPAVASNVVDFDVDDAGKAHLTKSSLSLNQVRPPRRVAAACGKVTLENGNAAPHATVYLWSLPFPQEEPRVANMSTTDEDGFFRLEEVTEGKYILSAISHEASGVSLGAFGGTRPSDAVPLSLPDESTNCSLLLTIHPQRTYSVRGRTKAGPGRTARAILTSGDAFPFEATAVVQPDGRYEFSNIPAGRYQFFAGWTGSGFDVEADIEDVNIDIKWPDQNSTPGGPPMPPDFNEAIALSELRGLDQAERAYAETYSKGFTRNLDVLGPPPKWYHVTADRAGLLGNLGTPFFTDEDATHFTQEEYQFTYTAGEPDAAGKITRYTVSARPTRFGKTGKRTLFMDESGAIHARNSNSPATKDDRVVDDGR